MRLDREHLGKMINTAICDAERDIMDATIFSEQYIKDEDMKAFKKEVLEPIEYARNKLLEATEVVSLLASADSFELKALGR
ncbi:hypothetical protein PGN80_13170 [Klebsiella aerogenes]|uniref:hypothetical protein n=1 Tax=Klebsiella aerogenes TaxID=548 RepID=UPI00301C2C08